MNDKMEETRYKKSILKKTAKAQDHTTKKMTLETTLNKRCLLN